MIYADCSKLRPWHHFNILRFKNETIILETVVYFLITNFTNHTDPGFSSLLFIEFQTIFFFKKEGAGITATNGVS